MRVMIYAGAVFTVLLIALPYLPIYAAFAVLVLGAVCCAVFSFLKKPVYKKLAAASFFVFAASLVYILNYYIKIRPLENSAGGITLTGVITEGPETNSSGYSYVVRLKTVGGENRRGKVAVYSAEELDGRAGDVINLIGDAQAIENDIFYNSKTYYYGKGIFLRVSAESAEVIGESRFDSFFINLKERISGEIKSVLNGEEGKLLAGVIVNDKAGVSDETKEKLTGAGYSHLINVSGLHMSIVASFMFTLLGSIFGNRRKLASAATILGILFYMAVTSFSVSAVRAGIMLIVYFLGTIIDKESDSLNSLGFAVTLIVIINPFAASDASFLLSALSTFGIIFSTGKLSSLRENGKIKERTEKCLGFILPSFSAVLFSAPAAMAFYNEINLTSAVSNLVIAVFITPLVTAGLLFSVSAIIGFDTITRILGLTAGLICKFILFSAEIFSKFSLMLPTTGIGIKLAILFIILGIVLLLSASGVKRKIMLMSVSVMVLLSFSFAVYEHVKLEEDAVYVVSGEEGVSFICRIDGEISVFGTDGKSSAYDVSNVLSSMGVQNIGLLHISKNTPDARNAAELLNSRFYIKNVSASKDTVKASLIKSSGIDAEYFEDIRTPGFYFVDGEVAVAEPEGFSVIMKAGGSDEEFPFNAEVEGADGKRIMIYSTCLDKNEEKDYNYKNSYKDIGCGLYKITAKGETVKISEVKMLGCDF